MFDKKYNNMDNTILLNELNAQRIIHADQIKHIDAILKFSRVDELIPKLIKSSVINESSNIIHKTYKDKIKNILDNHKRFLSINQMIILFKTIELNSDLNKEKKGFTNAKNSLLKDGEIVKYQVGTSNANCYYGLKEWLNEENKPKLLFMYKKK